MVAPILLIFECCLNTMFKNRKKYLKFLVLKLKWAKFSSTCVYEVKHLTVTTYNHEYKMDTKSSHLLTYQYLIKLQEKVDNIFK